MMDTEQRTRFGKLTIELFKRQSRKMAKHTQTILSVEADKLSVWDHFVGLALKGLTSYFLAFLKI